MMANRPSGGRFPAKMKPVVMGCGMGLMMLWMAHGALAGDGGWGAGALLVFVVAHVAVAAILVAGAVFAARLSPGMRNRLTRLHRPSRRHLVVMLGSAAGSAALAHLIVHGGLA